MVNGVLNIDKPKGLTSHDVVNQIRKASGQSRVGHAGTLDPFATGVLLVLLGKATRLAEYAHDLPKTYVADCVLGATSTTDDRDGIVTALPDAPPPTAKELAQTLATFMGTIQQTPPVYAAVKFKGKKLYELARSGNLAAAQAAAGERTRQVTIHNIRIESYAYPHATIEIACSTGTYIRALVRDIGERLSTGAYVAELRRTAIGKFTAPGSRNSIASEGDAGRPAAAGRIEFSLPGNQKAIKLEKLNPDNLPAHLHPMADLVAHLPAVTVEDANVAKLKQGKALPWTQSFADNQPLALFTIHNELFGIGSVDPAASLPAGQAGLLHPKKIF